MNRITLERLEEVGEADDILVIEEVKQEVLHLLQLFRAAKVQKQNPNLIIWSNSRAPNLLCRPALADSQESRPKYIQLLKKPLES